MQQRGEPKMKANEFVKAHGLQYTRNLVQDYPNHTHVTDDGRMFINENTCTSHIKVQLSGLVKMDALKRLVESHELVGKMGGVEKSKLKVQGNRLSYKRSAMLSKAITDVESCYD